MLSPRSKWIAAAMVGSSLVLSSVGCRNGPALGVAPPAGSETDAASTATSGRLDTCPLMCPTRNSWERIVFDPTLLNALRLAYREVPAVRPLIDVAAASGVRIVIERPSRPRFARGLRREEPTHQALSDRHARARRGDCGCPRGARAAARRTAGSHRGERLLLARGGSVPGASQDLRGPSDRARIDSARGISRPAGLVVARRSLRGPRPFVAALPAPVPWGALT